MKQYQAFVSNSAGYTLYTFPTQEKRARWVRKDFKGKDPQTNDVFLFESDGGLTFEEAVDIQNL
jgi:hypothetical protein